MNSRRYGFGRIDGGNIKNLLVMIKTAVVILNWNGSGFLARFLPDLVEKSRSSDCRIYLADNGSTDNSVEWTISALPEVEIIRMETNLGFSGGYNSALSEIDAEYFILVNSDIEVTEGWIKPLVDHLDNHPLTAICQPKILSESRRDYFEYAGAAGGYIDKYGYPFCRGRIQDSIEMDKGQYDNSVPIFWASGACMIIRSLVWKEMNGFDADFFAHMEEIDLCWRVLAAGYDIYFIPGSSVYHVGGGTLTYDSPGKVFLNFRNNLYMLHKNLPGNGYRWLIFRRMVLDGIAGIRFMAMLRFNSCFQIIRAHLDYYRHIRSLGIKRDRLKKSAKPIKEGLILNKSIIYGFYIKGKKLFTDYTL